jgi:excisionase family DNA binding protein
METERSTTLTVAEAAAALDLSQEYIRRLIRGGSIGARYKLGIAKLGYRIERSELARYARAAGEEDMARTIEHGALPKTA